MTSPSHPSTAAGLSPERRMRSRFRSPRRRRPYRSWSERLIESLLAACALVTVLTTIGIAVVLVGESAAFFSDVSIREFLTGRQWTPLFADKNFGVLPLVSGTLMITAIAAAVALPVGLASAFFLSQYASERARRVLKPGLELLAGVPTVVYGYFALTFVTPLLQNVIPGLQVYNALSAGIVVGVMIIPMVASLSEDALRAVPSGLTQGAYALGATRMEVGTQILLPAAASGVVASFILAISRAIGETMIVTLAAGATPKLTANPLESVQTMTSYIVQASLGDTAQGTIEFRSLFAVGLLLFLLTLVMNMLANLVIRKYREQY